MYTYTGQVKIAFPWLNLYIVKPVKSNKKLQKQRLVAGYDKQELSSGGMYTTYPVGSTVLVQSDDDEHGSMGLTDYIIGSVSISTNTLNKTPNYNVAPLSGICSVLDTVFDRIKHICGSLNINAPKVFNQPSDLLPGDTVISGSPGVGVDVLKHLVRIQCGNGCYVELDSILSRIRVVTKRSEYIGPLKYNQDMSGDGSLLEYNQEALTKEEGEFGLLEENPGNKTPKFRKTEVKGDLTSGWQTSIAVPSLKDNRSNEVYSNKVRYDGNATVISAKGFEIRKSLDIVTPYQTTCPDPVAVDTKEVSDFGPFHDDTKPNLLFDKSIDMSEWTSHDRNSEHSRVKNNPSLWDTSDKIKSDNINKAISEIKNRKLEPIGDRQYYDLPDTITLEDPHTHQKYTYFKSESGFRQDPDGSLVLYDGYGSEIRMTRGNIIISPAADLVMRPGRDSHIMSGRHTAIVSNKDVTVHSSSSDVYIKADKNFNVLSGVSDDGRMVIEDRGSTGVLIRSKSSSALVADDVFVGSIPDKFPEALDTTTKGSGSVTIGGGEQTLVTGSTVTMSGKSLNMVAKDDKNVSWLCIDGNNITSVSDDYTINGRVYVGKFSGYLTATIGDQYNPISVYGNRDSKIDIMANVSATYDISCERLKANYAEINKLSANNAHRDTKLHASIPRTTISVSAPVVTQSTKPHIIYEGPWTDKFTGGMYFKYPSSKELGVYNDYVIPGILWQTYIKRSKVFSVWNEKKVPGFRDENDGSWVYPGDLAWSGRITVGSGKHTTINGGYVING